MYAKPLDTGWVAGLRRGGRQFVRRESETPYACSGGGACAKTWVFRKSGSIHVEMSGALTGKRMLY